MSGGLSSTRPPSPASPLTTRGTATAASAGCPRVGVSDQPAAVNSSESASRLRSSSRSRCALQLGRERRGRGRVHLDVGALEQATDGGVDDGTVNHPRTRVQFHATLPLGATPRAPWRDGPTSSKHDVPEPIARPRYSPVAQQVKGRMCTATNPSRSPRRGSVTPTSSPRSGRVSTSRTPSCTAVTRPPRSPSPARSPSTPPPTTSSRRPSSSCCNGTVTVAAAVPTRPSGPTCCVPCARSRWTRHVVTRRLVVADENFCSGRPGRCTPTAEADALVSSAVRERTTLARAFAALPERWQSFLWLSFVDGADRHEIATILGINVGSVSALGYPRPRGTPPGLPRRPPSGAPPHRAAPTSGRCSPERSGTR